MSTDAISCNLNNSLHAESLILLLNEYALDQMGGSKELTSYTKNNLVATIKKRPDFFSFLVFEKNKAIGLLNAIENFSTFQCKPIMNIHDVYVTHEYRGKGISRKLFFAVESLAKERDCCKMTLEVLQHNKIARQAYENFGYQGNMFFMEKNITYT
ncbi:MAG: GNAT family N-acetyltransferase [Gammaproteobacteria bacterium]